MGKDAVSHSEKSRSDGDQQTETSSSTHVYFNDSNTARLESLEAASKFSNRQEFLTELLETYQQSTGETTESETSDSTGRSGSTQENDVTHQVVAEVFFDAFTVHCPGCTRMLLDMEAAADVTTGPDGYFDTFTMYCGTCNQERYADSLVAVQDAGQYDEQAVEDVLVEYWDAQLRTTEYTQDDFEDKVGCWLDVVDHANWMWYPYPTAWLQFTEIQSILSRVVDDLGSRAEQLALTYGRPNQCCGVSNWHFHIQPPYPGTDAAENLTQSILRLLSRWVESDEQVGIKRNDKHSNEEAGNIVVEFPGLSRDIQRRD